MSKKVLLNFMVFAFAVWGLVFAQEGQDVESLGGVEKIEEKNLEVIKGIIKEIAEDGSYIIVDDGAGAKKIPTTEEFLEETYFELDDKVEITIDKSLGEAKIVDYNYIFDDELDVEDYGISLEEEKVKE